MIRPAPLSPFEMAQDSTPRHQSWSGHQVSPTPQCDLCFMFQKELHAHGKTKEALCTSPFLQPVSLSCHLENLSRRKLIANKIPTSHVRLHFLLLGMI